MDHPFGPRSKRYCKEVVRSNAARYISLFEDTPYETVNWHAALPAIQVHISEARRPLEAPRGGEWDHGVVVTQETGAVGSTRGRVPDAECEDDLRS